MYGFIGLFMFFACYLMLLPVEAADQPTADGCIACHTDPARLRALVRAPAEVVAEEGEG
jgi:hypothetical protein